ncbi:MAG: aminoglycoside phosphotransferase family protein [Thermomicrobiales bacterium]
MFEIFMQRWGLDADGEPIVTPISALLPVRSGRQPAMLKILMNDEERAGSDLLAWWDGHGCVRVLNRANDAVLLERATGQRSLLAMAMSGRDDDATRIICEAASVLHTPRAKPPPSSLVPLDRWFAPLLQFAAGRRDIFQRAAECAERLLSTPREVTVLHGDLHHGNVLDGGSRGWLAIDPKGLIGERTFDFVNILRNPLGCFGNDPLRLARQVDVIARAATLDTARLLDWTIAFCGLSAVWNLESPEQSESARREAHDDQALLRAATTLREQM